MTSKVANNFINEETFSFDEGRELVTEARAHELLENLKSKEKNYTRITLQNKSYTIEAAHVIATYLKKLDTENRLTSLHTVDFADIIAGRPENEALAVLSCLCDALKNIKTLSSIDLSDNALGEKGVRACFGLLLEQKNLEHIYFCNNGISAAAAAVIVDEVLLYRGPKEPTKLKTFHFYNNMSGDEGAKALARLLPACPLLKSLRFSATRALRNGSLDFVQGMSSLTSLEYLDLSDNSFPGEASDKLAKILASNLGLKHLYLRDAGLEDYGMVQVAKALVAKEHEQAFANIFFSTDSGSNGRCSLQSIDVSGNDLTSASMKALAELLNLLTDIQSLQIEENEIGSKGAKILAKSLVPNGKNLTKLVMNANEIGSSGALAIVNALLSLPETKLEVLELDGNQISASALSTIEKNLESAGKKSILKAMEDNDDEADDDEEEEEEEEEEEDEESDNIDKKVEIVRDHKDTNEKSAIVDKLADLLDTDLVITSKQTRQIHFCFADTNREVVNAEHAKSLLDAVEISTEDRQPLPYTSISLRGKTYTQCGANVISSAFLSRLQVGVLEKVDLADVIAGRPESEALEVLRTFSNALREHKTLKLIDLSDNALGEKGVRACFDLLKQQQNLESLLFCNNGISAMAASVIATEILLENVEQNEISKLSEFHFYNNMSGPDGCTSIANALSHLKRLRKFRYASARAGPDASCYMAEQLSMYLRDLEMLDLSDCSFHDKGAEHLAAAVGKQKNLRVLKLRDAALGQKGIGLILMALHESGIQLEDLDLSGNELAEDDGDDISGIGYLLSQQRSLHTLYLDENELTSRALTQLIQGGAFSTSHIETLSLVGNEITASGAINLLTTLLGDSSKIRFLLLDGNQISAKGVDQIHNMLDERGYPEILGPLDDNDDECDSDDE